MKKTVTAEIVQDWMDYNWVGEDRPMIISAFIQKQEVTSDSEISTKYYYTICLDRQGYFDTTPEKEREMKYWASPLYDNFDDCVHDMNGRIMPLFIRGRRIE